MKIIVNYGVLFIFFALPFALFATEPSLQSKGSQLGQTAPLDYGMYLQRYFSNPKKRVLRKNILSNDQLMKEFILDFYSDISLANQAEKEGYGDNKKLKWQVDFFRKKLIIAEIMADTERKIVFPDFTEIAKERYLANKKHYTIFEKRKVRHILLKDKVKKKCSCEGKKPDESLITVERLLSKINQGEDFAELAKKYSKDVASAKNGGLLPDYVDGSTKYLKDFEDAVYRIKNIGDISKPIKTRFGTHIIKLIEVIPAKLIPFDDVKESILRTLKEDYKASVLGKLRSKNYPDLDKLDFNEIKNIIEQTKLK